MGWIKADDERMAMLKQAADALETGKGGGPFSSDCGQPLRHLPPLVPRPPPRLVLLLARRNRPMSISTG